MNTGLSGFAAGLIKYPMWVMNVVPFVLKPHTLGVVYDRGLIGTSIFLFKQSRMYQKLVYFVFSIFLFKQSRHQTQRRRHQKDTSC